MARKMIKGSALAAVCLLLFLAVVPREAHGAVAVDTSKKDCTMRFSLGNAASGDQAGLEELEQLGVPVMICRIASVTASGAYVPESGYEEIGLQKVNSSTSATDWRKMAEEAAEIMIQGILVQDETGDGTDDAPKRVGPLPADLPAEGKRIDTKKTKTLTDLDTGMYLVLAFETLSDTYAYSFAPYLVAVPGNQYASLEGNGYGAGTDAWVYDVDVTLKPAVSRRWGYLRIVKNLTEYRAGDEASFIFQIEAEKAADSILAAGYRYSNVVQYRFTGPGSQDSILIRLPVGTTGTVEEVAPGAGYRNTDASAIQQIPRIEADEIKDVTFTNTYDGSMNGGTSIVNHFLPENTGGDLPGPEETDDPVSPQSEGPADPDSIVWTWIQE